MDTAAIQNAAVQTMASGLGVGGIQSAGSDGFAALIQQLLANMMEFMEGMEDGSSGLMGGELAALLGQQMQEDTQEQGTQNGMEMLADLFFNSGAGMFPQDVEALQGLLNQGQQVSLQGGNALLARWELFAQAATAEQGTQPMVRQDPAFDLREALQQMAQQGEAEEPQVKMEVVSSSMQNTGEDTPEEGLLGGEGKFSNAILEAKRMMKNSGSESKEAPVDVESLQRHADAGRLNTVQPKADKLPDVKDIAAQVKTGILENTAQGKNEFVIKLKPDGLGEITVKMLETSGRISLSILTNSTQVAKLLSSEILSLKEALRPYEADVREIVTQNENAYASSHDGQFANQQFDDGQRQQAQYAWEQHKGYVYQDGFEEEDGSLYDALGQTLDPELDRYI